MDITTWKVVRSASCPPPRSRLEPSGRSVILRGVASRRGAGGHDAPRTTLRVDGVEMRVFAHPTASCRLPSFSRSLASAGRSEAEVARMAHEPRRRTGRFVAAGAARSRPQSRRDGPAEAGGGRKAASLTCFTLLYSQRPSREVRHLAQADSWDPLGWLLFATIGISPQA